MLVVLAALLAAGGFTAGVILLVRHMNRRQEATREDASRRLWTLGAAFGGHPAGDGFEVDLGGCLVSGRLTYHKATPTGFTLSTRVDDGTRDPGEPAGAYRDAPGRVVRGRPQVLMRRETATDRLGKRLRVNREVQTGDGPFDDAVYVESSASDGDVQAILADARVRHRVMGLLDLGFRDVVLNEGDDALRATYVIADLQKIDAGTVRAACEHLRSVARALPAFAGPRAPQPFWTRGAVVVIASALLGMASFFALGPCLHAWPPITAAAHGSGTLAGLFAWIAAAPLLAIVLRGRASSFRMLIICLVMLLVGLPLSGMGAAVALNGALDDAPAVAHATQVLSTRVSRGKNGATYYVTVAAWPGHERSIELRVSSAFERTVRPGTRVVVTVGPGYLGWEWTRSIRLDTARKGADG